VDDNPDTREIYGEYLRLSGLHVDVAADGESAIRLALATGPDVVVMDLSMPGISGCEAVRRLTADSPAAGMAIIAFSADDSDGTRAAARAAGCCEFVAKPCPPDQLLDVVRGVHARHGPCPSPRT